jgi:hypothetical protein
MFLVMLLLYYVLENRRRAMRAYPEGEMGAEERLEIWLNKTDKENPRFRYIL